MYLVATSRFTNKMLKTILIFSYILEICICYQTVYLIRYQYNLPRLSTVSIITLYTTHQNKIKILYIYILNTDLLIKYEVLIRSIYLKQWNAFSVCNNLPMNAAKYRQYKMIFVLRHVIFFKIIVAIYIIQQESKRKHSWLSHP